MSDIREKPSQQAVVGMKLEPLKHYNVVFLNDEVTPVDVPVSILHQVREDTITLETHNGRVEARTRSGRIMAFYRVLQAGPK